MDRNAERFHIIDAHAHFGECDAFDCPDGALDSYLKRLEALCVETVIVAHAGPLMNGQVDKGHELALSLFEQSHGKIRSYLIYDPREIRASLSGIERAAGGPFFAGIKIHPSFHKTDAGDEAYRPVWDAARRIRCPILTHSWEKSDYNPVQAFSFPDRFQPYVAEYGDVPLILGHSGGRGEGITAAISLCNRYPNVYLDLAGDVYGLDFVARLVREADGERVLFGSDINWFDPSAQMGMILGADITDRQKRAIFNGNAHRLFGI